MTDTMIRLKLILTVETALWLFIKILYVTDVEAFYSPKIPKKEKKIIHKGAFKKCILDVAMEPAVIVAIFTPISNHQFFLIS